MITKTINTLSGTVKLRIPENLSEITLSQMIAMESVTDEDNSIPLIPGLTKEVVDNIISFEDLINIRERVLSLAHQIKYCYNETAVPKTITFGTKKIKQFWWYKTIPNQVKVITNLSIEPAGAYLESSNLILDEIIKFKKIYGEDWKENFIPSINICAEILAHYFYCRVTGNLYSIQKAEEFKEEILKLPVQTAIPIARYFFLKYPNLSKRKIKPFQAFRMNLKKRLASKNLNSLDI